MRHVDLSNNMLEFAGVRLLMDSSWQLDSLNLSNNWPTSVGNTGVQALCKGMMAAASLAACQMPIHHQSFATFLKAHKLPSNASHTLCIFAHFPQMAVIAIMALTLRCRSCADGVHYNDALPNTS